MEEAAKWVVIIFGLFIIYVGFLMLFAPSKALEYLEKMASTNLLHFGEITIRLLPAFSLVIYADQSLYPLFFKLLGYFMIATSLVLYIVPRRLHHQYALNCASLLQPAMVRVISPISFLFGSFLIYAVG